MKLKEWLETVDYRITEGSEYGWRCFGDRAYSLSYWNGDHDGHSMNVVFDTETQDIYTAEVCDYTGGRAYRWIHPEHLHSYKGEVINREVNDVAWEDTRWTDLEVFDDWKAKTEAIRDGRPYDLRVSVPIELPDDEMFQLMIRAHKEDITLNQLVERILTQHIGELSGKNS